LAPQGFFRAVQALGPVLVCAVIGWTILVPLALPCLYLMSRLVLFSARYFYSTFTKTYLGMRQSAGSAPVMPAPA